MARPCRHRNTSCLVRPESQIRTNGDDARETDSRDRRSSGLAIGPYSRPVTTTPVSMMRWNTSSTSRRTANSATSASADDGTDHRRDGAIAEPPTDEDQCGVVAQRVAVLHHRKDHAADDLGRSEVLSEQRAHERAQALDAEVDALGGPRLRSAPVRRLCW